MLKFTRPSAATIVALVVAVLALGGGTATAAKLITSKDIKNGSIALSDLAPSAKKALKGRRGAPGAPGAPGPQGPAGATGAAGYSTGVVTASTAFFPDGSTDEGWGAWLDNTGNARTGYLVVEVYCASGDIWWNYTAVGARQQDGTAVLCDPGDMMLSGGWWTSDTSPTAQTMTARAKRASASQRPSNAAVREAFQPTKRHR
jgi:hypothetical protein